MVDSTGRTGQGVAFVANTEGGNTLVAEQEASKHKVSRGAWQEAGEPKFPQEVSHGAEQEAGEHKVSQGAGRRPASPKSLRKSLRGPDRRPANTKSLGGLAKTKSGVSRTTNEGPETGVGWTTNWALEQLHLCAAGWLCRSGAGPLCPYVQGGHHLCLCHQAAK